MNNEYELFKFQNTLDLLRSKYSDKAAERGKKRKDDKNEQLDYDALLNTLNSISEDMDIKDMLFYKEYLAKFEIEKYLGNFELKKPKVLRVSEADYDLLLRLVFASFSSKYDLILNDNNTWSLVIKAKNENNSIQIKLDEIGRITISRLMDIYIGEMFEYLQWEEIDEEYEDNMDQLRQLNILVFERKASNLKFKFDKKSEKGKEIFDELGLIAELDRIMEE